ncbi:MAG: hypothetical protein ACI4WS_04250 [Oscillospiraceae bacterium]
MAVDKKNRIKRVVLSWLCVAALVSGAGAPTGFPSVIPALVASAEAPESVTATINLNSLLNYATNGTGTETFEISSDASSYKITIKQSGTYILKGSNLVNESYVDVQICASECNVDMYCDNAYIKNSYSYTYTNSSEQEITDCIYPFDVLNGSLKLSGSLAVETYINTNKDYFAPLWKDAVRSKITADFFTVDYKSNGKLIDRSYFLNGSTYSDKNDVLDSNKCREVNGTYFDAASVSGAAEVTLHADHSPDETGRCQNCGEVWIIDLAKLVDYKNGTAECPYGLSFNTPEDFSDIL